MVLFSQKRISYLESRLSCFQSVMEYEEHEKRAWSVDFSRTEPSMLVSGSDDCKVKVMFNHQLLLESVLLLKWSGL